MHISIVFVGHVDAGKSTIAGHLLKILNNLPSLEKHSWILDTNEEERMRSKTMEIGKARFQIVDKTFTILDAPGHRDLIPKMLSGVVLADVAILVISDRGEEFEIGFDKGGQTREHVILLKANAIRHVIVLINKMDSINWNESRFLEIKTVLETFLSHVGYTNIPFIPVSGETGDFLVSKRESWYTGFTFVECLATLNIQRQNQHPLRVIITGQQRTGLVGRVIQGTLSIGQQVTITPSTLVTTITGINQNNELCSSERSENEVAYAGDEVIIKCKTDITLGNIGIFLCGQSLCKIGFVFLAEVIIVNEQLITAGAEGVMHINSNVCICVVKEIVCKIVNNKKHKTAFLKNKDRGVVVIICNEIVCFEKYTDCPVMGAFCIRNGSSTIMVGKILKEVTMTNQ